MKALSSSCHWLITRTVDSALSSPLPAEGPRAWSAGSPLSTSSFSVFWLPSLSQQVAAGTSPQDAFHCAGLVFLGCRCEGTGLTLVAMWLFSLLCPQHGLATTTWPSPKVMSHHHNLTISQSYVSPPQPDHLTMSHHHNLTTSQSYVSPPQPDHLTKLCLTTTTWPSHKVMSHHHNLTISQCLITTTWPPHKVMSHHHNLTISQSYVSPPQPDHLTKLCLITTALHMPLRKIKPQTLLL